jgi:hypothetical protein
VLLCSSVQQPRQRALKCLMVLAMMSAVSYERDQGVIDASGTQLQVAEQLLLQSPLDSLAASSLCINLI